MNNNIIEIIQRFQTHHARQEERERTWVPAQSDFKVPNETYHTRIFMIVEFNNGNDNQKTSPEEKELPS